MFDLGSSVAPYPWRTPQISDLADHDYDSPMTIIQEVLTHEVGHVVANDEPTLLEAFKAKAGWRGLTEDEVLAGLLEQGIGPVEAQTIIDDMAQTRGDFRPTMTQLGEERVQPSGYGDGFWGLSGSIPDDQPWGYAQFGPDEHFAEFYTKAVHAPEHLYRDLIETPSEELHQTEDDIAYVRQEMENESDWLALEEGTLLLQELQQEREERTSDADQQAALHAFYRSEVFGVDDSDLQEMVPPVGQEALYEEFKAQARMCMTPFQLDKLKAQYAHLIPF